MVRQEGRQPERRLVQTATQESLSADLGQPRLRGGRRRHLCLLRLGSGGGERGAGGLSGPPPQPVRLFRAKVGLPDRALVEGNEPLAVRAAVDFGDRYWAGGLWHQDETLCNIVDVARDRRTPPRRRAPIHRDLFDVVVLVVGLVSLPVRTGTDFLPWLVLRHILHGTLSLSRKSAVRRARRGSVLLPSDHRLQVLRAIPSHEERSDALSHRACDRAQSLASGGGRARLAAPKNKGRTDLRPVGARQPQAHLRT